VVVALVPVSHFSQEMIRLMPDCMLITDLSLINCFTDILWCAWPCINSGGDAALSHCCQMQTSLHALNNIVATEIWQKNASKW